MSWRWVYGGLLALTVAVAGTARAQPVADPLVVAAGGPGSADHAYAAVMADLVAASTGRPVDVLVTGGPLQSVTLVEAGRAQIGILPLWTAVAAWRAENPLAPGLSHGSLRMGWPALRVPMVLVTRADGSADGVTGPDMTNPIGVGPAGGVGDLYGPLLISAEARERLSIRNGAPLEMAQQLRDGLIGVMLSVGVPPTEDVSWLETQTPLRLIGLQETAGRETVGLAPYTVPADRYASLRSDLETLAVWSVAVVRADVDDATVDVLMTIADGATEQLADAVSGARGAGPEDRLINPALPFHPAALRWYEANDLPIPEHLHAD